MLKKLLIILSFLFISPTFADEEEDKAEFKRLYAEFNELYATSEELDPIIEIAEKVYEIAPKAYGETHMNTAVVTYNLASLYMEKVGTYYHPELSKQAKILFEEYFDILDENDSPKDKTYVNQYLMYMRSLVDEKDQNNIRLKAKTIRTVANNLNYELYELAHIENTLALLLMKNLQYETAKDFFETAKGYYEQAYGSDHIKVAEILFSLAKLDMGWKKRKSAEKQFLNALDIFESNDQAGSGISQSTHAFLVQLYEDMGRSEEATLHCQAVAVERPRDFDVFIEPLYRKNPLYPNSALRGGQEGYVILEFDVDTNGFTKNVKAIESDNDKFIKNSVEAAKGYRYAPSVKNGELVETKGARVRIEFKIAS